MVWGLREMAGLGEIAHISTRDIEPKVPAEDSRGEAAIEGIGFRLKFLEVGDAISVSVIPGMHIGEFSQTGFFFPCIGETIISLIVR